MKKLSNNAIALALSGVLAAITAGVMIFALLTVSAGKTNPDSVGIYLFLTILFLSVSKVFLGVVSYFFEKHKYLRLTKNIVFAVAYLGLAITSLIVDPSLPLLKAVGCIFLLTVVANRVLAIVERPKVGSIIINTFLAVLAVFIMVVMFTLDEKDGALILYFVLICVIVLSLLQVLGFAFSKIQLGSLLRIIRQTYVFEIIYGLIILMVSFSFFFTLLEENIKTFGDGLWYSFAVITTIGFGDFTVTSMISRILSVILGIYGIVVVSSITSVIVNFYNETKSNPSLRRDEEGQEETKLPNKDEKGEKNEETKPSEEASPKE